MQDKMVCFIGHRHLSATQVPWLTQKLKSIVRKLIEDGYCVFAVDGGPGFGTLAAQTVTACKEDYPHIRLLLVLPYPSRPEDKNPDKSSDNRMIRMADDTLYVSSRYVIGCMRKRDRYLVDNSSLCVCYLQNRHSNTYRIMRYAMRNKRKLMPVE